MSGEETRLRTWMTLVVVGTFLIILVAVTLPRQFSTRHDYREKEVKANLHAIQLAIERYAVDHDDIYPSYLTGGQAVTAEFTRQPDGSYNYWYEETESARASDVLTREGYFPKYPQNPFSKTQERSASVLAMQEEVRTSVTGDDPLRPGTAEAAIYGTRFGADGKLMGQVLCDPRFEKWQYVDGMTGAIEEHDTWAIIEYQFWDMWLDPKGKEPYVPFSPGQFFYKSWGIDTLSNASTRDEDSGELVMVEPSANQHLAADGNAVRPICPTIIDTYILGGYGSLRSRGKDVLGEESSSTFFSRTQADEKSEHFAIEHWTRSQYSQINRQGSPYAGNLGGDDAILYGAPNGIADAIILCLTDQD